MKLSLVHQDGNGHGQTETGNDQTIDDSTDLNFLGFERWFPSGQQIDLPVGFRKYLDTFLDAFWRFVARCRGPLDGVPIADIDAFMARHARCLIDDGDSVDHSDGPAHAISRANITARATLFIDANTVHGAESRAEPVDQGIDGADRAHELAISPAFVGEKTQ